MKSIYEILNLDFEHLFVMFLLFAFTGWICEEVYCTIGGRKLVKRGMLFGPICPIYGFGGIIIAWFLFPWKNSWLPLFFASMILTSILEYFTSWLLEKLFHAKWWDYSKHPFNIKGRVCLLNSTLFGVLGLFLWHFIEPKVYSLIYIDFLQPYFHLIFLILSLVFAADIIFTIYRLVDFNKSLEKIKNASEHLKEQFEGEEWFNSQNLYTMISSVKQKAAVDSKKFTKKFLDTLEKYNSRQKNIESWIRRFPTMTSEDYGKALEHIKSVVNEKIEEQKVLLNNEKEAILQKTEEIKMGTEQAILQATVATVEIKHNVKEAVENKKMSLKKRNRMWK